MASTPRRPSLGDLVYLRRQLAADKRQSPPQLRQRDHEIGQQCRSRDKLQLLLFWLDQVAAQGGASGPDPLLQEKQWALLLRTVALVLGASGMAGLLLASERALVNVPLFLLLFVLLQFLLCLFAGWVTLRTLRGEGPVVLPFNPTRLIAKHLLADRGFVAEAGSVCRLLLLRYGQELGALFALGAVLAFLVLLAVTDFSFVWGSTFSISDSAVRAITRVMAAPWSLFFPQAVVPAEVISGTRFHPAQLDLGSMAAESRRGWWPFLFACLLFYTLLPRVLLWMACLWGFRRQLRASLLAWPGVPSVLARMGAPVVETRAADTGQAVAVESRFESAVLLDWAGALDNVSSAQKNGLPLAGAQVAGLGSPAEDVAAIAAINAAETGQLLVVVRGWEPPMADLADVLAEVTGIEQCTLLLATLPGRELNESHRADWQRFSRDLPFQRNAVELLGGGPA